LIVSLLCHDQNLLTMAFSILHFQYFNSLVRLPTISSIHIHNFTIFTICSHLQALFSRFVLILKIKTMRADD
jgi:hypothetical protein